MSRLIDAEALKKTFCAECDHTISCEYCDIDFHFERLAPTVEAIPIEWLEDIIEDWKDEARKIDEARKKMTAKSIPSDSIEALARIVELQGKRIDALVNELEKTDAQLEALKKDTVPIKWLREQAGVDGLIERWRKQHEDNR